MGISLNIKSRNEHLPEIERYIRTVKEGVRAIANSLPFGKYPPLIIADMVYNIVFWLNSFLHKDRVHATISSRTLLMGFGNCLQQKSCFTTMLPSCYSYVSMHHHTFKQHLPFYATGSNLRTR